MIGPLYHGSDASDRETLSFAEQSDRVVLATVGSSGDVPRLAFLTRLEGCRIIVASASPPGYRVVVCSIVLPIDSLLPHVDVLVSHGGNGSILQALAHGVRSVCLTSMFEQEWNARRVDVLGVGTWLEPGNTDDQAVACVREWMDGKGEGRLGEWSERIDVDQTKRNFRKLFEEWTAARR